MGQTMPKRLDLKSLNYVKQSTNFNKGQVRDLYKGFREMSGGHWEIDKEHFMKAFKEGGVTQDEEFLQSLFNTFDTEKTDKINFREFCTAMSIFIKHQNLQDTLDTIFHMYDVGGEEYITKEEMVECLNVFGKTLEMKEFSGDHCDNVLDTQQHIKEYVDQVCSTQIVSK
eukprot:TRINITY_DN66326_c7_g1_i1.p1 TRINITY_DN66326_c7_g1~~TRINITY_DN66326_c7_g1_i1.p1  ORF type:complete len:170 (+),score=28.10 TRINITY_DN66326_c7_g1_i1:55-564(+)